METIVKITWDEPEDENWLNPFNIGLALSFYYKNTHFMVEEIKFHGGSGLLTRFNNYPETTML